STRAPSASETELAVLEMDILSRLDRAGALFGEPVSVTRTPTAVRVEALAETRARKGELMTALSPLAGQPEVRLSIRSIDDVMGSSGGGRPSEGALTTGTRVLRDVAVTQNRFSGFDEVRQALASSRGDPAAAVPDRTVEAFAAQALDRAR